MAKKYIGLNNVQKDEIRRLTQFANRRIKAAEKEYRKAGKAVIPREIAGEYQVREKWNTKTTPISRSIKFTSQKEYRQQLKKLQEFERVRPSIKEYTTVQRSKTLEAVETSLGGLEVPPELVKKIDNMTAPDLSTFWNTFSDKSARQGFQYSSNAALTDTMSELFPEDIKGMSTVINKGG